MVFGIDGLFSTYGRTEVFIADKRVVLSYLETF
jgi:hypothetical protein